MESKRLKTSKRREEMLMDTTSKISISNHPKVKTSEDLGLVVVDTSILRSVAKLSNIASKFL